VGNTEGDAQGTYGAKCARIIETAQLQNSRFGLADCQKPAASRNAAYAANAWAISSLLLRKWEQPERTFGMLGFAALLTYAETFPPFYVAASTWGV
jgi:hypothetical protein